MTTQIDSAMPVPRRRREASFSAAVADLDVGEQVAKLTRIDASLSLDEVQAQMVEMQKTIRNNTVPAVARAKERTGGQYTIEVTDFMTNAKNWFLIAVVTRTA